MTRTLYLISELDDEALVMLRADLRLISAEWAATCKRMRLISQAAQEISFRLTPMCERSETLSKHAAAVATYVDEELNKRVGKL